MDNFDKINSGDFDKMDSFGRFMIETLKDFPLSVIDSLFSGEYIFKNIKGLSEAVRNTDDGTKDLIRACVTEASLHGMTAFLDRITKYNSQNKDVVVLSFGENICDLADGELGGYIGTKYGWDAQFSKYPGIKSIYDKYNAMLNEKKD